MVLCDGLGTWTLEADAMTKSVMLFFFFSKHHHCHVEFPLKLLLIVFDLAQDGTSCHLVWSSASSAHFHVFFIVFCKVIP